MADMRRPRENHKFFNLCDDLNQQRHEHALTLRQPGGTKVILSNCLTNDDY